jgi:hypothetical protein
MTPSFIRQLLCAVLRKPDYRPPTKPSSWRVVSAESLGPNTPRAACSDEACGCTSSSRLHYQPKG